MLAGVGVPAVLRGTDVGIVRLAELGRETCIRSVATLAGIGRARRSPGCNCTQCRSSLA